MVYAKDLKSEEFFFIKLSEFHSPGYFSMYLLFSIAVLLWFILKRGFITNYWIKVFIILLVVYFVVFIVMLCAKAGMISVLGLFSLVIGYMIIIRRKYLQALVMITLVSLSFVILLKLLPCMEKRFIIFMDSLFMEDCQTENEKIKVGRMIIWSNSLELIHDHFFSGVGTGDVTDNLTDIYKEKNLKDGYDHKLNAHNQYLQTFLALGVFGFSILVLALALPAIVSLKKRDYIYFCFLIIIAFYFLIESMLERQAGVVFYAYFNALLFTASGVDS